MSLFQLGKFMLASGQMSLWKIECDNLDDGDWECLAYLAACRVPQFRTVIGIPRGGLKFAEAISPYRSSSGPRLVVDDVFTTGTSIKQMMRDGDIALVAFARAKPPPWLYTVLEIH